MTRSQSAFDKPKTHAERRGLNPRVACRNKWRRIELLQRNKAWQKAYRAALDTYRAGDTTTVFPHGTYQLTVERHARARPEPDILERPYAARLREA